MKKAFVWVLAKRVLVGRIGVGLGVLGLGFWGWGGRWVGGWE